MNSSDSRQRLDGTHWLPWVLLVLGLVVTFALQAWRNTAESTIWKDEMHTLTLALHEPAQIVDLASMDSHPPLYFLFAHAWMGYCQTYCDVFNRPVTIGWMRGLSLVGWVALATMIVVAGRRHYGMTATLVACACVLWAGQMTETFRNVRNYALLSPLFFGCFVVLVQEANAALFDDKRDWRRAALGWLAYAGMGAMAWWMHLLGAMALASLGAAWVMLVVWVIRTKGLKAAAPLLVLGGAAQVAIIASFVPWLLHVPEHWEHVGRLPKKWLTPATIGNLLKTFAVWMPMGDPYPWREAMPAAAAWLALLTVGVPVGLAIHAASKDTPATPSMLPRGAALVAFTALGVGVLNVFLQWIVQYLELSKTFHGTRYPATTTAIFIFGLVGVAAVAVDHLRWRPRVVALVMTPWIMACAMGHAAIMPDEADRGIAGIRPFLMARTAGGREPLYFTPWRAYPFFKRSLSGLKVRPLTSAFDPGAEKPVRVLNPNWVFFETDWPDEEVMMGLLSGEDLSKGVFTRSLPKGAWEFLYVEYEHFDREECGRRYDNWKFQASSWRQGLLSGSMARPETQRRLDGWSSFQANGAGEVFRWAQRDAVTLRFHRDLDAGSHRLILKGVRREQPPLDEPLRIEAPWWPEPIEHMLEPGPFRLVIPFETTSPLDEVTLRLHLSAVPMDDARDRKRARPEQSFRFDEAWIGPIDYPQYNELP